MFRKLHSEFYEYNENIYNYYNTRNKSKSVDPKHSKNLILNTPKLVYSLPSCTHVQFFAYKMTVESENSMLKHRNVDLNTVSLEASDCTYFI
jgi:hypothetical protein